MTEEDDPTSLVEELCGAREDADPTSLVDELCGASDEDEDESCASAKGRLSARVERAATREIVFFIKNK